MSRSSRPTVVLTLTAAVATVSIAAASLAAASFDDGPAAVAAVAAEGHAHAAAPVGQAPGAAPAVGGAWSDARTWGGAVPGKGSHVTVPAGKTVVLDTSAAVADVTVLGTLVFSERDLTLTTGHLMVHRSGTLRIGTASTPFAHRATINLTGTAADPDVMGMGSKFLGAMDGGRIQIFGPRRVTRTKLAATVARGARALTLAGAVDWRVGERVMVAPSSFSPAEAEERIVTAVRGRTVTLDRPLQFRHFGSLQAFDGGRVRLDERAEVALLSRSIRIQGDAASARSRFGGHVMIMGAAAGREETVPAHRSSARISGVEFLRMGQFDHLGRYPIHWHQNGSSKGDLLRDSVVHGSIQRGIVLHGTSDVLVQGNVVVDTRGHAVVLETGSEKRNVLEGNLTLRPLPAIFTNPILKEQHDERAAGFWIKSANNVFRGNVAAGGGYAGFWFDEPRPGPDNAKMVFTGNTIHSHAASPVVAPVPSGTEDRGGAGLWLQAHFFDVDYTSMAFSGVTLYKNGRGVWADDVTAGLRSGVLADNMTAATGNIDLTDAAVVGLSANREPGFAGGVGVELYNNVSHLRRVTFVNYSNGATALKSAACRFEGVRFQATQVRLVGATVPFCTGDTVLEDVTGTMTGTGRRSLVVGDRTMYTAADGCRPNARFPGAVVCVPTAARPMDHLYLFLRRDLKAAPDIIVRRDADGLQQTSGFFPNLTVAPGNSSVTLGTGLDALDNLSLYLDGPRIGTPGDGSRSRLTVAVPSPSAPSAVWRGRYSGGCACTHDPADPGLRTKRLTAVSSMAALTQADGAGYFYDTAAKKVVLLLGRATPVFLER